VPLIATYGFSVEYDSNSIGSIKANIPARWPDKGKEFSLFVEQHFYLFFSIKVDLRNLHLDAVQLETLSNLYASLKYHHHLYSEAPASQELAQAQLQSHSIDIQNLEDLGNKWSKRWKSAELGRKRTLDRVVLQW
jgi:hypothetical protein